MGIALAQELCSDSCDNAVLRVLHGPEGCAVVSLNMYNNAVFVHLFARQECMWMMMVSRCVEDEPKPRPKSRLSLSPI